jgi:hypothetical protein
MKDHYLITGGAGFIGTNLADHYMADLSIKVNNGCYAYEQLTEGISWSRTSGSATYSGLRGRMVQIQPTSDRYRRLGRAYTAVARTLLSTFLVFVLFNAMLYVFPSLRADVAVETPISFFGVDRLLAAYTGWSSSQLIQLHNESRVIFAYEPIVQFRIKPMSGSYVNASPHGFRFNARQAPWPPSRDALNVFVFGGSTTFGWLLPDRETIVSQL